MQFFQKSETNPIKHREITCWILPFCCTKILRMLGSLQVRNLKVPRYKLRPGERNLQPQKTPKLPSGRSTVSWWWNEWNNEIAKTVMFWKVQNQRVGKKNHTEKWSKKTGYIVFLKGSFSRFENKSIPPRLNSSETRIFLLSSFCQVENCNVSSVLRRSGSFTKGGPPSSP